MNPNTVLLVLHLQELADFLTQSGFKRYTHTINDVNLNLVLEFCLK